MNLKDQKVCSFCMARAIKRLYKSHLGNLEFLIKENYIDQETFDLLRKQTLDLGNDQIRDVDEFLNHYRELSYSEGTSEFSDINALSTHITNTVAHAILEWDGLRKKNLIK